MLPDTGIGNIKFRIIRPAGYQNVANVARHVRGWLVVTVANATVNPKRRQFFFKYQNLTRFYKECQQFDLPASMALSLALALLLVLPTIRGWFITCPPANISPFKFKRYRSVTVCTFNSIGVAEPEPVETKLF